MAKSNKLRKGTKVQYKHGRGMSTGEVVEHDGSRINIKTRNGSEVFRPADAVAKA